MQPEEETFLYLKRKAMMLIMQMLLRFSCIIIL